MKIIDYKLLLCENYSNLTYEISQGIKDGWQPYGDLKLDRGYYLHALVKYE